MIIEHNKIMIQVSWIAKLKCFEATNNIAGDMRRTRGVDAETAIALMKAELNS